ncbi:hypothetical protein PHYPSEUDO_004676 [Phytophthora pseudosyringae]|uniref:Histone-lysine N-methyltransferase, H3 lysine-79 specific n=1 Tax=Phytophthora pseudosyringae TaxID=221518 RepID=A0A8T1VMT3_9STRA|nr:hypothetical protein PHYPSEUDO_004676 [Phytophthora pseudosyringae]
MKRSPLLTPSEAERAVRDIFSGVLAADVRQQAGKIDENAGELLPTAVLNVIQIIGNVQQDDVFLDIGAGLGNVAAQFAIQTNARQCLGIEKRPELVSRGVLCLRTHAVRVLLLHKVILHQGNVLDMPLSSTPPFQGESMVFLNDFLFDETAKLVVQQELCLMPRARLIISTSRYCPRHRGSCRRSFCAKWKLAETTYGRGSWSCGVRVSAMEVRDVGDDAPPELTHAGRCIAASSLLILSAISCCVTGRWMVLSTSSEVVGVGAVTYSRPLLLTISCCITAYEVLPVVMAMVEFVARPYHAGSLDFIDSVYVAGSMHFAGLVGFADMLDVVGSVHFAGLEYVAGSLDLQEPVM